MGATSSRSAHRRHCSKEIDGKTCEPMERMIADVPTDAVGAIMERWALVRASWFP